MIDDEYLWSGRGKPDPETARLEKTLRRLRWSGTQPKLEPVAKPVRALAARWWMTAAAMLALTAVGFIYVRSRNELAVTSWLMTTGNAAPKAVRTGQIIQTSASAGVTVQADFVGQVDIGPASRLRLLPSKGDEQKMALEYGTIRAFIWAPPAQFVVDTPAAKAIDLGCRYTLQVAKNGDGFLSVDLGWVAFQAGPIESFIPAGAACHTRRGHGPDTPYFVDAAPEFIKQLAEFNATGDRAALDETLALARPRDGLTIWHLMQRSHGQNREAAFHRLARLVALPPQADLAAVMRGDQDALSSSWNALNLGDTNWWRNWKRHW